MKIESYYLMKNTFNNYKIYYFNRDDKKYIIYFNENLDLIQSGWLNTRQVDCNAIYIVLNNDEFENFNEKIYEEKVSELQLMIKKDKVNKKLKDLESDFV